MIIRKIALNGFRNYEFETVEFAPGTNVISGQNAQGKTNLLEAVYMLSCGRSFRTRFDRELVGFGYSGADILADVYSHEREQTINIQLRTGQGKKILVNGVKKTAGELADTVNTVLKALNVGPEALFSTLGRTAARGVEAVVVANGVGEWLQQLEDNIAKGDNKICINTEVPKNAEGVGFVHAPRGGLSHWMVIENGKIANFQMVVPSTWNLGPRCAEGKLSAVEAALVGTPVADPKRPVEILRTVHSFDPCIACGVHVIDGRTNQGYDFKVL